MTATPLQPRNLSAEATQGGAAAPASLAASNAAGHEFAQLVDNIPFPLTYVDRSMVYRLVNRAYSQTMGRRADELLGQHIRQAHGEARWARHRPYYERALAGETAQYLRLVPRLPQGPRWLRSTYAPHFDAEGKVAGVYTVTVDVHDITLAQERLRRSVERDELTDAFSRRAMMDRIGLAGSGEPMALFFVDLDGFKAVNDVLGHAAGDTLLVAVARALQGAVRANDCVGRFGGDEFLVLAAVGDAPGAQVLAGHLLAAVRACGAGLPPQCRVSASIGYALSPADSTLPLQLLQLADTALYAAKRAGGDRAWHCSAAAG